MNKIIYIIPGFRQHTKTENYKRLQQFLEGKDLRVKNIHLDWNYKTMTDYVEQFKKQLIHGQDDEVYIFGFSFGAVIACISAQNINVHKLILASLSPYFQEDLQFLGISSKKSLGKKRYVDFQKYNFTKIAQNINTQKIVLLYGENESGILKQRVQDAKEKLKNAESILAIDSGHDIFEQNYFKEIKNIF